jgi:uncharacterized protein YjiS (DUF1127 family)
MISAYQLSAAFVSSLTPSGKARSRRSTFGRIWEAYRRYRNRARQRGALAMLDDRLLADIGISRADAERECNKPFWSG